MHCLELPAFLVSWLLCGLPVPGLVCLNLLWHLPCKPSLLSSFLPEHTPSTPQYAFVSEPRQRPQVSSPLLLLYLSPVGTPDGRHLAEGLSFPSLPELPVRLSVPSGELKLERGLGPGVQTSGSLSKLHTCARRDLDFSTSDVDSWEA